MLRPLLQICVTYDNMLILKTFTVSTRKHWKCPVINEIGQLAT